MAAELLLDCQVYCRYGRHLRTGSDRFDFQAVHLLRSLFFQNLPASGQERADGLLHHLPRQEFISHVDAHHRIAASQK